MLSIPGTEALSPAVKYVIAFAIIFLLLALFALVLRRLTGGRLSLPSQDRGRSRQPRLGIVDVYDLDRQRQLILLRRDNVEHLLLIGGPNDVVVETNLVRAAGARLPPTPVEANADRPESFERALEAPSRPLIEPQRPEPVVARLGSAAAEQPVRNGPATLPPEPVLKPDVVALSPPPPPPPRPAPPPMREPPAPQPVREPPPLQAVREPPPPPPPPPQAVREPPPAPVQRVAPVRQPPPPPREAPPPPEPPVIRAVPEPVRQPAPVPARPDATVADAAVLSNMAKQLEEALKRPLSTGRPGPNVAPHPNGPAPSEDRAPRAAPAPAARPPQAVPAPAPAVRPPEPAERPRPVPTPVTRMRPVPEPEAPPAPAPEPPAPAAAEQQSDPFSVEEIEAEFARLLGRPLDRGDRPH